VSSLAGPASPAYVLLAHVAPVAACALLGAMRRSCSEHRQIRRAAPLAVLLAGFVVLWVLGLDVIAAQRDYYHGAVAQIDADWHALVGALNGSAGDPRADPGRFLGAAVEPVRRSVPLLSVVLEPLLKAALTFSVITGIVNRKSTDTAAAIAALTAARQLADADAPDVRRHLLCAAVTAGVAALLCAARYTPLARRLAAA
jgi:type VI protein secretion system component VasF